MRFLALTVLLFLTSQFVNSQEETSDSFVTTEERDRADGSDEAGSQYGSVTFAFDGGTLLCSFGRIGANDSGTSAMILFPRTARTPIADGLLKPPSGNHGSVVISVTPDGKETQINRDNVVEWAKARVANIASRDSTVEEHAFIAAVVHTVNTGNPLTVWGSSAQEALESGQWCKLFATNKAKPSP